MTDAVPTEYPDIRPDPARVIARLSARIAALESENAQLDDVVRQMLEQRNDVARAAEKAQADAGKVVES